VKPGARGKKSVRRLTAVLCALFSLFGVFIIMALNGATYGMRYAGGSGPGSDAPAGITLTLGRGAPFITIPQKKPPDVYRQAKLAAVGDLMAHEEQLAAALNKKTGAYDFSYAFRDVKEYLQSADLAVGNLETVFAGEAAGYSCYPRFNTPDAYAAAIAAAGFDLLTTANNHSNDKNGPGIFRTIDVLDQNGIGHVGTYKSAGAREEIKTVFVNGIVFAFLSYSYGTNGIPLKDAWSVNLLDRDLISGDIRRAKALDPDFIIVLPHMGDEYAEQASDAYRQWVRFMFESGADIVLASHPHVLQPVEFTEVNGTDGKTRECFAAYSLGNFVTSQRTIPRDEGIILNLYFEKKNDEKARLINVSYIPTWVRYIGANGAYDVHPIPVSKILGVPPEQSDLRAKDIIRVKSAYKHILQVLSGGGPAGGAEIFIK